MAAGAAGGAAAAAAGGAAVAAASGATGINPPSIAGHDMMWKHVMSGGQWHWASWWQMACFFCFRSGIPGFRWSDDDTVAM